MAYRLRLILKFEGYILAKTIHSMIRVLQELRSVVFYHTAFGLAVAERLDFETFTLIYLSNQESEFELELTVNKGRSEPYALGDGYGHLAVSVDNLDAEHQRLAGLGFNPGTMVDLNHDGKKLARFFFISDPDGYKIEVLQRGGRYL
jgi:lactoylglutathione lyase